MKTCQIEIVSAQKAVFQGEACMVIAPGVMGDLGIVAGHSQLLTKLLPGEVLIHSPDGQKMSIFVSGGFMEVQPDLITILSDVSVRTAEIDEEKVRIAEAQARKTMDENVSGTKDYEKAYAELIALVAQLRVLENSRKP